MKLKQTDLPERTAGTEPAPPPRAAEPSGPVEPVRPFGGNDVMEFNYRSDSLFPTQFHSHAYYEVYFFHEGNCNYLIGDQTYRLAPGDLILMYGMTLHCAKIDPSVPYIRSIVHFDPAILRPFLELPQAVDVLQPFRQFRNYRLRLRGAEKAEVERILLEMAGHKRQGDAIGGNRLLLAFVDLLVFLYGQCLNPLREQREFPSEKERTVQGIIALLETSYGNDELSMDWLQERLHLSKSYLAKIFREVTGVTLFEYIFRKRINEAKILFQLQPELSVTDVCFRVGFKHLAHFSRMFKRQVGFSPDVYRKRFFSTSE